MAGDDQPAVVRSVQSGGSLQLVVQIPASPIHTDALLAPAFDVTHVSIVDLFGTPVEVAQVQSLGEGTNLLHIQAIAPPADPGADAPAYQLTVGGGSTWFAPESQDNIATSVSLVQTPPGTAAINYLGRDYAAFTALMRSRVSQIVRDDAAWALDHPADPMTTIIEALAYAGDHLSFRQDAAGTEAYLPTARHRLSLRRHARLRDYPVNEGCAARTALVFTVKNNGVIPAGLQVVTQQPGVAMMNLPAGQTLAASTTVFEMMADLPVSLLCNNLAFPLSGSAAFTLEPGTIQVRLNSPQTGLVPGQLLAFVQTAAPAGVAQPFGAQIVRLLKLDYVLDGKGNPVATIITWHPEDALTRPLTVAAQNQPGMVQLYGNVGLADHGRTIGVDPVPDTVPSGRGYRPTIEVEDPVSACPPPAFSAAFDGSQDVTLSALMVPSAVASLSPDPAEATLCVTMAGVRPGMAKVADLWTAGQDLLSTPAAGRAFAAAPEDGFGGDRRHLFLRFGDGVLGEAPAPGTVFTATARVGDGQSGHVRANALVQIVGSSSLIGWVTNPLPATPVQPEKNESIRLFAATAFRTNVRGIEPADWERIGGDDPLVTEVEARVGDDGFAPCRVGIVTTKTIPPDITYPVAKARLLEYAVLGAPPVIDAGIDVPVNISLVVYCVAGANISAVRERLLKRIGAGAKPDGGPAHFHPASWPLGRPVLLAELIAVLEAEPMVSFVVADPAMDPRVVFCRVDGGDTTEENVALGQIAIGPGERARADNDAFQPEFGIIRLYVAAAK